MKKDDKPRGKVKLFKLPRFGGLWLHFECDVQHENTFIFFSFQISEPPGTWSKNTQHPLLSAKKTVLTTLSMDLNLNF